MGRERGEGGREGESRERERKPVAELSILCYTLVNIQLSCIMALPVKTFLDSNKEQQISLTHGILEKRFVFSKQQGCFYPGLLLNSKSGCYSWFLSLFSVCTVSFISFPFFLFQFPSCYLPDSIPKVSKAAVQSDITIQGLISRSPCTHVFIPLDKELPH